MDIRNTQLHPNQVFHIYNRGINGMPVFFEDKNYRFFLNQLERYVLPFSNVYAYCLLKNHFHLLIKVRDDYELDRTISQNKDKPYYWHVSNGFSSLLKSYTRAINKVYSRTGPLFEPKFKRIHVENDYYFSRLVMYIHHNPVKHNITRNFEKYLHSSYLSYISRAPTRLERKEVLSWFGGIEEFIAFHRGNSSNELPEVLLGES